MKEIRLSRNAGPGRKSPLVGQADAIAAVPAIFVVSPITFSAWSDLQNHYEARNCGALVDARDEKSRGRRAIDIGSGAAAFALHHMITGPRFAATEPAATVA